MVFSTYEEKWYNAYHDGAMKQTYPTPTIAYDILDIIVYSAPIPTWAIDGVL